MQVYAATRGHEPLRVYNLRYKDSFEQDKYAASLRREQSIFEELIRAKGRMVLPDLQQARLFCPCCPTAAGRSLQRLVTCNSKMPAAWAHAEGLGSLRMPWCRATCSPG